MNIQPIQNLEQAVHFIQTLPIQRQKQIYDFIDMVRVYELNNLNNEPKQTQNEPVVATKNAGKFSDIFGMVKTKKSVSLAEMNEAIAKRGAKL